MENHVGHIQWVKATHYIAIKDSSGSIVKGAPVNGVESWTYDEYGDEIEDDKYDAHGNLSRKVTHQYYPNGDIKEIKVDSYTRTKRYHEICTRYKGQQMPFSYRCEVNHFDTIYVNRYDASGNLLYSAECYSCKKNAPPYPFIVTKYFYNSYGKMLKEYSYNGDTNLLSSYTLFRYNKIGQMAGKVEWELRDGNWEPIIKTVYEFDKNGREIEVVTHPHPEGSLTKNEKADTLFVGGNRRNDEHFNGVQNAGKSNDGKMENNTTCQYKYDSVGNWIEQILIANGMPRQIIAREIHYFPDHN